MKHVEILKPVSEATRRTNNRIKTLTVYMARWSSLGGTPVVVLGYLGNSTWKVFCLISRRETTAKTAQLGEPDPTYKREKPRDAREVMVNDETLALGTVCRLSSGVESAILYEGPSDRAKHVLDKDRLGYVSSVPLKKGTQVMVVRDAKWRCEVLDDSVFGPKARVRLADGRYCDVPRCLLAPVAAKLKLVG